MFVINLTNETLRLQEQPLGDWTQQGAEQLNVA